MATHCSNLAWRISWTEEPGGLQFMGSKRVEQDLATEQQQIKHSQRNQFCPEGGVFHVIVTEVVLLVFSREKLVVPACLTVMHK